MASKACLIDCPTDHQMPNHKLVPPCILHLPCCITDRAGASPPIRTAGTLQLERQLGIRERMACPAKRANKRKIPNAASAKKNRIWALPAVAAERPEKPKKPATREITKKISA